MDDFATRMKRLSVEVASPDRTVRARYSIAEGITVECRRDAASIHGDSSLGSQLGQAVTGVYIGRQRAIDAIMATQRTPGVRPNRRETAATRARRSFQAEAALIVVNADSTGGRVRVELSGDGRARVAIRPGTLDDFGFDIGRFNAEVGATVRAAAIDLSARRQVVRRKAFPHFDFHQKG